MLIIIKDCSYPTCYQLDTARIRSFCDENKRYPPVKDFETKERSKARNSQRRETVKGEKRNHRPVGGRSQGVLSRKGTAEAAERGY